MSDVVVTVPRGLWDEWIDEGDLPGEPWMGDEWAYHLGGPVPTIAPGERVYVVAHGQLRGWSPLVRLERNATRFALIRGGGAEAVTIPEAVRGFRGWRYRWWPRGLERPFPWWRTP